MKKIKVLVFTTTVVLALFVGMANAEYALAKEKIVFASDRSGNWDIWMIDQDGTNLEQLTTNSFSDTSPQISPDGTKIAFISDRTGSWQVWMMNSDGSDQHQLFDVNELSIPYGDEYGEKRVKYVAWAPDGSYLITHIELWGVHSAPWSAIYRHDHDGSNPLIFMDWGPSIKGRFSISSDGSKFAYCREDSNYWSPTLKISIGDIVGGVVDDTSIYNQDSTIDKKYDVDVGWFSNGNKLMWSKSNNPAGYGAPQNLYSMNIDETNIIKLTDYIDKYAIVPDFSPDEKKVVFQLSDKTTVSLYTMNPDGSNIRPLLVDDYKNSGPCWGIISYGVPQATSTATPTVMAQETQTTLFEDDFSELNLNKWTLFGSPSPRVLASLEGRNGVFDNNGDGWCDSGAVSKDAFSYPKGFTMESDIYVSVTNNAGCWDAAVIGLTKENTPYMDHPNCPGEGYYTGLKFGIFYTGDACWATPQEKRRHAYFDISLLTEDGSGEGPGSYAINADDYIDGWHNLKIVVGEDRIVSFYCDDKLIYKSERRINEDILRDKKIFLGQRSSGSAGKAYHDFVKITSMNGVTPTPTPTEEPLSTEIRGVFVRPTDLFENLNMKDEGSVNDRIKKMANDLKNHNINVVFVAFKSDFNGKTFYTLDNFPYAYYFADYDLAYDPMKNMVDTFRDHNIEVHAWVPVFHDKLLIDNSDEICIELGFSTPSEVRQPYKKDKDSEIEYSEEFADPNNPCVLKYEEVIIEEIFQKYPVDGINLDYIRYNDSNAYFDDETNSWISSYTISKGFYEEDGADKIVDFVKSIRNLCCKKNVILSADVFGGINYAKECVGQNIPGISEYVNVLMPMLYGRCPKGEGEAGIDYYVDEFKKLEYKPLVVPCVRAFTWDENDTKGAPKCSPLEPTSEDVKQLIRDSVDSGDGFALFNYMTIVGKQWGLDIGDSLDWDNGLDKINEVLSDSVITPWKKSSWVNKICPSNQLPTVIPIGVPGFEAVFALSGLLVVAYLLRRRK